MSNLHERFLSLLAARGWTVHRATPVATPADSSEHAAFLSLYTQLSSADDTRWFLSAADYAGTADSAFGRDAFRDISLEAAISDADRHAVEAFWARHVPIFMSVDGDYEFLAIDLISGRVVHGVEPEFEAVSEVASSLGDLFEQMLADDEAAALLG
ncbi:MULTISPECIES: hypothetical protein [unclassified Achromobacter]|uniref:hypothetical protein n=1 Tax=unclassified Achromobacter TaxID=2626865 RepID=UPI00207479D7|nr:MULTISPECIES: hypothetical protein [unclassified Achromobacter]MDH1302700.1 hypothetical protein [Achromobacter sp. GD03932]